jgi:hypothetical protein
MNIKDLALPYPKLASELRQREKLLELYQKKLKEAKEAQAQASRDVARLQASVREVAIQVQVLRFAHEEVNEDGEDTEGGED